MIESEKGFSNRDTVMNRHEINGDVVAKINIENDTAVQQVARMVVAGVDRKHSLHPFYEGYIDVYGEVEAKRLIENKVKIEGACDVIQTEINSEGLPGLFGGLSENGDMFVFYEWLPKEEKQMSISMTVEDARAIVRGEKKDILFTPASDLEE